MFNERLVCQPLIDCACSMDWPSHRLVVQVLWVLRVAILFVCVTYSGLETRLYFCSEHSLFLLFLFLLYRQTCVSSPFNQYV